ncbi:hypothetical protein WDU94_010693 [Cyamophila willieti]
MLGSQEEQYRKDLCGHPDRRPHLSIQRHQLAVRPKPSSSLGPGVIETISSIAWSSVLLPLIPETRPAEQPASCSGPESSLLSTLCRDEGSVTQLITQARGESMTCVHLDIGISPQSRLRKPLPVSAAVLMRWRALVYSELRYRVVDERAISNPSVVTLDNPLTAVSCASTILIDRSRVVDIGLIIGILQFDNLFVLA